MLKKMSHHHKPCLNPMFHLSEPHRPRWSHDPRRSKIKINIVIPDISPVATLESPSHPLSLKPETNSDSATSPKAQSRERFNTKPPQTAPQHNSPKVRSQPHTQHTHLPTSPKTSPSFRPVALLSPTLSPFKLHSNTYTLMSQKSPQGSLPPTSFSTAFQKSKNSSTNPYVYPFFTSHHPPSPAHRNATQAP